MLVDRARVEALDGGPAEHAVRHGDDDLLLRAVAARTMRAASEIEPPVEIMSSTMITLRPSTSPITCSTAISEPDSTALVDDREVGVVSAFA